MKKSCKSCHITSPFSLSNCTLIALNGLLCADVPLRNYSLTHCSQNRLDLFLVYAVSFLNIRWSLLVYISPCLNMIGWTAAHRKVGSRYVLVCRQWRSCKGKGKGKGSV